MAHQPYRPFESLEWYRDAARNNFRDDAPAGGFSRWARGPGMLHAHICVFAASVVVLLVINMLRSPGNIWADKWIMAWTVLILIHAVAAGILWAIRQWNTDVPGEPLQMASPNHWRQSGMFAWGSPEAGEAQDAIFRITETDPADIAERLPDLDEASAWTGWNADTGADPVPASERASWKEASAAAWLDRGPTVPDTTGDPEDQARR